MCDKDTPFSLIDPSTPQCKIYNHTDVIKVDQTLIPSYLHTFQFHHVEITIPLLNSCLISGHHNVLDTVTILKKYLVAFKCCNLYMKLKQMQITLLKSEMFIHLSSPT